MPCRVCFVNSGREDPLLCRAISLSLSRLIGIRGTSERGMMPFMRNAYVAILKLVLFFSAYTHIHKTSFKSLEPVSYKETWQKPTKVFPTQIYFVR